MTYPISKIRSDFPILSRKVNNKNFVYLDSASSAQKPNSVIDAESEFYRNKYASVHRSIHTLSNEATILMENIRKKIAIFINASSTNEIIFTKGATEGINLIANSWGRNFMNPGDNIIITEMEHHSNIVPWQILAKEKNLIIRYIPLLPDGNLNISKIPYLVDEKTRLFAITQVSNVLGTLNPLSKIINIIRKNSNALIIIDGAQGIMHQNVDVQNLDCDFYVFSAHKIYGPSYMGVLYGKKELLDSMPPWQGGGSMINTVSLKSDTTFNDIPWKFEAGTPNIVGIIGLGAAIDYVKKIGLLNIYKYEKKIMKFIIKMLKKVPNLIIYGPSDRIGIVSFNIGKYHAYDIGTFLDQYGIAIRTGHHCAMPLMSYFNVESMCRISLGMYTNKEDIEILLTGLLRTQRLLGL